MEQEKEQLNYTLILHQIRKELKLTLMEYCVADSIYHLSNNPKSKIQGWCFATKETIARFLGTTRQTIFDNLNKLVEKGFIERDNETKYLRTTQKWYEKVVLIKTKAEYQETLHIVKKLDKGVKKPYSESKETLLQSVKKLDSYNNSYSNSNKNKNISPTEIEKTPPSYGNEDINTIYAFLRDELGGSPDGSQKENRRFAHLLLTRFKKDYPDKEPVELVKFLIEAGLKDSFHGKNITNFKYLFYHTQQIIQSVKGLVNNPKYIKL